MTGNTLLDTYGDYRERLQQRVSESAERETILTYLWQIAHSADRHLLRFEQAARRRERAMKLQDKSSIDYEQQTMLALLYETLDTVFIVIQVLDPNVLRLESSLDGKGIAGEDASFVTEILEFQERICAEIKSKERMYELKVDFTKPVDEREGITFSSHSHWQDFVPGSTAASFTKYFAHVQESLNRKLGQKPRFWQTQTLGQALIRSRRPALLEMIGRLQKMNFPDNQALRAQVEKSYLSRYERHWEGEDSAAAQKAMPRPAPAPHRHQP